MYLAKKISCSEFSSTKLKETLPLIRSLIKEQPKTFIPALTKYLREAGIKFIYLPYLKGSNISGVTRWIMSDNSIMIAVNDYGKDLDKMWFSIFHELGHAVRINKRNVIITTIDNCETDEEKLVDEFARNQLINKQVYEVFINKTCKLPKRLRRAGCVGLSKLYDPSFVNFGFLASSLWKKRLIPLGGGVTCSVT